jgi:hypothetical protein
MTYCSPGWISPYTFEGIFAAMPMPTPPRALPQQTADGSSQPYLVVSGLIGEDGQVLFNPVHRLNLPPGNDDVPGNGAYRIELRDNTGRLLSSHAFDLEHHLSVFYQTIPEPEGVTHIALFHEDQVLGRLTASTNAPEVTLLEPGGGQTLSGNVMVRWAAADADGDDLTFALQYSPDGGDTWGPIVHGLTETTYSFDAQGLAGSEQGLLKVVASDGFHSTADTSNGMVEVPHHAPQVTILHPADGARFTPNQVLILQGQGLDKEDGELAAGQLLWSSDRDGELGSGRELAPQGISEGWHTITLTVTDSDGRRSSAAIRLYVGTLYGSYLPWVR